MRISNKTMDFVKEAEKEVSEELKKIDEICEYNSQNDKRTLY